MAAAGLDYSGTDRRPRGRPRILGGESCNVHAATPAPVASRSHYGSIAIIGALFFIFGFVTWLNGPLISFAQLAFDVSDTLRS